MSVVSTEFVSKRVIAIPLAIFLAAGCAPSGPRLDEAGNYFVEAQRFGSVGGGS